MALVATSVVQQSYTAAAAIAGGSGLQVDDLSTLAAVTETHVFSPLSAAVVITSATHARFALPYACVITGVQFGVAVAPAVASISFDVKAATVSVFTTLPTIEVGEFTTSTSAIPGVLSNTAGVAVAANAEIAISAVLGSSTTTAGETVTIQLRRTS